MTIRPWHPFTKASQQAVKPDTPELHQIEIYPTSNVRGARDAAYGQVPVIPSGTSTGGR